MKDATLDQGRNVVETKTETLIIGGGPAGLQLGYFLHQANRDYMILEKNTPGSFFRKFPRHRTLISINKVYTGQSNPEINLRWDWNSLLCDDEKLRFRHYSEKYFPSADDLVDYLEDFVRRYELRIRTRVEAARVSHDGESFVVTDTENRIYRAARLVAATGVSLPCVPGIPGIEHAETYDSMSIKPDDFTNQRVLILGKGDAAFETADNLLNTAAALHLASPSPLRIARATPHVTLDATCERIEKRDGRYHATFLHTCPRGERQTLVYDRVICCTGFRFSDRMFDDSCRPRLTIDNRFPELTSAFESTNIPGLYFAGTLMQSGFINAFRYNVRALHRILESRYFDREWPHDRMPSTGEAMAEHVIARTNRSSALWHQAGFLCDLLIVPRDGGPARYYEELPTAYVNESAFGQYADYYTITLEPGALRPMLRRYSRGALVSEHHAISEAFPQYAEATV
jgi:thioredoxin reductase